ncbi:MAG TPA: CaiB/BaiF CoA-transferase family protein [Steroidobacteraceae bacterium]
MTADDGAGPLSGIVVIDAGQVVAGPSIATFLGDFGATVIKVERPGDGDSFRTFGADRDGVPLGWKFWGRNKKSVTLDLRVPEGQAVLRRLVEKSDVLIESFRPGTMESWGLSYEALAEIRPELVMVRVSGYGQTGPYSERPGFGSVAEAMSGFSDMTGFPGGPPVMPPMTLADCVAGLYGAYGVAISLYNRQARSGRGQCIDISLLEPLASLLGPHFVIFDQLARLPQRDGNRGRFSAPRNTFITADDRWISIAGSTQSTARRLFEAMDRPELIEDARFATNRARLANVEELEELITAWTTTWNLNELYERLVQFDVPAGPIWNVGDLMSNPQMVAREAIVAVDDEELGPIRMPNVVPRLSDTPGRILHAGPPLGSSTDVVYRDFLGMTESELSHLREQGVV